VHSRRGGSEVPKELLLVLQAAEKPQNEQKRVRIDESL